MSVGRGRLRLAHAVLICTLLCGGTCTALADDTILPAALDDAIHKSLAWLEVRAASMPPLVVPVLRYVQRRHADVPGLAQLILRIQAVPVPPGIRERYQRLFEPEAPPPKTLPKARDRDERIILRALYCDVFPPDEAYCQELQKAARRGGYGLTHVAIALCWIQDRRGDLRCFRDDLSPQAVAQALLRLAHQERYCTDVGLEALAYLSCIERSFTVPEQAVAHVLRAQRADGGFSKTGSPHSSGNTHTTVLALWVLLDARSKPNEMIPWFDDEGPSPHD